MPKPELKEPADLRRALESYISAGGPNAAYARVRLLALDSIAEIEGATEDMKSAFVQAVLMAHANAVSEVIGFVHPDMQAHWALFSQLSCNQALEANPNIRKDIIDKMTAALEKGETAFVSTILADLPKVH